MATLPQSVKREDKKRGSEKLLRAWKSRVLTEESIREIATELDKTPARIEEVGIVGGENPTGMFLALSYVGDDAPFCGTGIQFWLQWLRKHGSPGTVINPPRIIINGTPWPEFVRLELEFGQVETTTVSAPNAVGGATRE
jgi:hypothetical protein